MGVSASNIGQFFARKQCFRFLKRSQRHSSSAPSSTVASSLDRHLEERGRKAQAALRALFEAKPDRFGQKVETANFAKLVTTGAALSPGEVIWMEEVPIWGTIGAVEIGSQTAPCAMDFVCIRRLSDSIRVVVLECKSSAADRLSHRFQLATYAALAQAVISQMQENGWGDIRPEFFVVRQPPATVTDPAEDGDAWLDQWHRRELTAEDASILIADLQAVFGRLAAGEGSDEVIIGARCDGCRYRAECLKEVVDSRSSSLLGLTGEARAVVMENAPRLDELAKVAAPSRFHGNWEALQHRAVARLAYYADAGGGSVHRVSGYIRLPRADAAPNFLKIFLTIAAHPDTGRIDAIGVRSLGGSGVEEPWVGLAAEQPYDSAERQEAELLFALVETLAHRFSSPPMHVHLYYWTYDEMSLLGQRIHAALAVPGFPADRVARLRQFGEFLAQDNALARANPDRREDWVSTTLREELLRRYALGPVGATLMEISTLNWKSRHMAERWITPELIDFVRDILEAPPIGSVNDLCAELRRSPRFSDALPPLQHLRALKEGALMGHWLKARVDVLASLEAALRQDANAVKDEESDDGERQALAGHAPAMPDKIPYTDNPFLKTIEDRGLASASLDFHYLNEARSFVRQQASLLATPDQIIASDKAIRLASLERIALDGNETAVIGTVSVDPPNAVGVEALIEETDIGSRALLIPVEKGRMGKPLSLRNLDESWIVYRSCYSIDPKTLAPLHRSCPRVISNRQWKVRFCPGSTIPKISLGSSHVPGRTGDLLHGYEAVLWTKNFSSQLTRLKSGLAALGRVASQPDPGVFFRYLDVQDGLRPEASPAMSEAEGALIRKVLRGLEGYVPHRRNLSDIIYGLSSNTDESSGRPDDAAGNVRGVRAALEWLGMKTLDADPDPQRVSMIERVLASRLSCIQGPPGTGKTEFAAWLIVCWLARFVAAHPDTSPRIVVVGYTHRSIDELLQRVRQTYVAFRQISSQIGLEPLALRIDKVTRDEAVDRGEAPEAAEPDQTPPPTLQFSAKSDTLDSIGAAYRTWADLVCLDVVLEKGHFKLPREKCAVPSALDEPRARLIGCTAAKAPELSGLVAADLILVDEASMLTMADFAAVLPVLKQDSGQLVVVGDDRQLPPIVDPAWSATLRPGIRRHRPDESLFARMRRLHKEKPGTVDILALENCRRCPADVRDLFAFIYKRDGVDLIGNARAATALHEVPIGNLLTNDWEGVRLITYSSRELRLPVRNENMVEQEVLKKLLPAEGLSERRQGEIAVLAPFRVQVNALGRALVTHGNIRVDTIDRMQGAEQKTVVLSMVGHHGHLSRSVEFLFNLNRHNVAMSRSAGQLIVICAEELLDYVPTDDALYESLLMWRRLKSRVSHCYETTSVSVGGRAIPCRLYRPVV